MVVLVATQNHTILEWQVWFVCSNEKIQYSSYQNTVFRRMENFANNSWQGRIKSSFASLAQLSGEQKVEKTPRHITKNAAKRVMISNGRDILCRIWCLCRRSSSTEVKEARQLLPRKQGQFEKGENSLAFPPHCQGWHSVRVRERR